jgi:Uma2 family endonuclease
MLPTKLPMITRHDYQEMQEGPPYYQVIEGDLIMSPSPTPNHQRVALNIAFQFQTYLAKHPVGEVFIAPLDVFLSDINVYQPDVL